MDGTLITTGGAGRRALERAFQLRHGEGARLEFSLGGMTDRAIVRAALRGAGQVDDDGAIDAVLEGYLAVLEEEVGQAEVYGVHPGVESVLAKASADAARFAVGLGTGNIRRGAEIKLARVGLNHYFLFGGYGSDHEDRGEIIRLGAQRGAALLGRALHACRVVIIGDTPRDVAAARAIGAECVAVGTSGFSVEALLQCGATAAFTDLTQGGAVEAILGPGSSER